MTKKFWNTVFYRSPILGVMIISFMKLCYKKRVLLRYLFICYNYLNLCEIVRKFWLQNIWILECAGIFFITLCIPSVLIDPRVNKCKIWVVEDLAKSLDVWKRYRWSFLHALLPGPKLCFWTVIIFIRVYVSVCLSVCLCLSVYLDYLKKFLNDFHETWQDDV